MRYRLLASGFRLSLKQEARGQKHFISHNDLYDHNEEFFLTEVLRPQRIFVGECLLIDSPSFAQRNLKLGLY